MADASDIKVNIEESIHIELRRYCNAIAKDHGLFISQIRCDWIDTSSPMKKAGILSGIEIVMHS